MLWKINRIPPWRAALDGPTLLLAFVHSLHTFRYARTLDVTMVKAGWCWPPFQIRRNLLRLDP